MLKIMAETDILLGMHGAGLAHAAYLQPGAMLVEIKDKHMREKKIFVNMASKQDVGYYLFDAANASQDGIGTVLSDWQMESLVDDLWKAWGEEVKLAKCRWTGKERVCLPPNTQCLFPRYLDDVKLSSFEVSRCYLEYREKDREWIQCHHYGECSK